ncbi:MAG: DNA polymerase I [Clostridia bacterium]|nr:DNA polymerase I [Clostridia bacterium]
MKKLLILDANSIVNRAFYAVKLLTNKEGFHTNAIFGFFNIFFKYLEEISPDFVCAAFDLPAPTFRHKMYDGYKATRHKMPEELAEQMPVLKEILAAMNIKIYEKEGYEADDIIGTVSRICTENEVLCCVLTGDKDDLQLASSYVNIHLVTTRMGNTTTEVFDDKKVFEKYGVTPKEFIDLKAIMGDSSDNIPGVKGIGEKGATALISAFHSVDGIYENIDDAAISKSTRAKLIEGKEDAKMSKILATIDRFVPMDIHIPDTARAEYDNDALFPILERLELRSFIKKLGLTPPTAENAPQAQDFSDASFVTVTDEKELEQLLKTDDICFLIDEKQDEFAFCFENTTAYSASISKFSATIHGFLESNVPKITHGLKDTQVKLLQKGLSLEAATFDTQIGAYLLEPSRKSYDLEGLARDFLNLAIDDGEAGTQLSLDSLLDKQGEHALSKKVLAVFALKQYEEKALKEQELDTLFSTIEMPLVYVLASMEHEGFRVDKERLLEFGKTLSFEISALTKEIYDLAGHEFNINSPKQLGTVLFEELGLKSNKKTKSGYSTNADVLEKLRLSHPIVDRVLEYRKLSKLNSTYVEGLMAVIDSDTGKVHSSFNQTVTVTGRISSTEPNLQNIPVRTPLGREMRKMFVAKSPDYVLVDADYSQIELRVLAHLSGDENMIAAFASGFDIHAATAAKIFRVAAGDVTPDMRSAAKAINFGLVYGMGEFSLSQDLHISVKAAKDYIEDYLGSYPKVRAYMQDTVSFAKEHGYVKTMFGRKRALPEILSSNYQLRTFGERAAMNSPVQGTAADIIKLAMVNVYNRLKKEKLNARLILQVHDELIIEAAKDSKDAVCRILKEEMETAVSLLVPLKVDMETGHSWYDTK